MAHCDKLQPPTEGEKITTHDGRRRVPDHPIVPFIEGDGTGPDIRAASVRVFDAAPGANIGDRAALFEGTNHGTAPKCAGHDKVNPGSLILSGVTMLDYMGWREAGELIECALERTLEQKRVTYDFHRQMEGATKLSCSGFGDAIIENIQNV